MAQFSLEQLNVAEPCHASWNQMRGNATGRLCGHCQKTVHDLSAMPREEAERLVCQSAGELCIRFTRAADGQVLTLDYQTLSGKRRWSWKNLDAYRVNWCIDCRCGQCGNLWHARHTTQYHGDGHRPADA
jgi:hypothetical protein